VRSNIVARALSVLLSVAAADAFAQAWTPQKNVEIVAASGPGGSNDKTARTIERALVSAKLVPTTIIVVNKPGGGGSIAGTYVAQRVGDPHALLVATSGIGSNHIIGASTLTLADYTPIAIMLQDYVVFAVAANSPLASARELADRLRKDPRSVAIGFANTFGGSRHIAAGLLLKALGGNPRDLKTVVFKGSAEAIPAVLGGHIDLVVIGAGNAVAHVSNGRMRVLAVAAPQRLPGVLANVPTWREQGANVVSGSWRGVFGAKGLTPSQIAYWENAMRRVVETAEWKADLEANFWQHHFVTGAALRKELDQEYADDKAVLVDLGLAKH
jgi:putative tricarboxylic transport membrane protein